MTALWPGIFINSFCSFLHLNTLCIKFFLHKMYIGKSLSSFRMLCFRKKLMISMQYSSNRAMTYLISEIALSKSPCHYSWSKMVEQVKGNCWQRAILLADRTKSFVTNNKITFSTSTGNEGFAYWRHKNNLPPTKPVSMRARTTKHLGEKGTRPEFFGTFTMIDNR